MNPSPSDVMIVSGEVVTSEGTVDVSALVKILEADGFTVLTVTRSDGRYEIRARWPQHLLLGGRSGAA